jgi:hypothetical protein
VIRGSTRVLNEAAKAPAPGPSVGLPRAGKAGRHISHTKGLRENKRIVRSCARRASVHDSTKDEEGMFRGHKSSTNAKISEKNYMTRSHH